MHTFEVFVDILVPVLDIGDKLSVAYATSWAATEK